MTIEELTQDTGATIISRFKGTYQTTQRPGKKPFTGFFIFEVLSNGNFRQLHKGMHEDHILEKHVREELDELMRIYNNSESDYAGILVECYKKVKEIYEQYDRTITSET